MIICRSNNFVVIRPPKTGSTSLIYYFFRSGLVHEQDSYVIDGPFSTWESFEAYHNKYGENYTYLPEVAKKHRKEGVIRKNVHVTFNELVEKQLIEKIMPCASTIRHPIERFSSAFHFVRGRDKTSFGNTPYSNPNAFWDALKAKEPRMGVKVLSIPQCDYFPEHAELFNTENLHEHVSKYILGKGGKVDGRIEMRKNPDNKLDVFLAELTPDRKQDILDTYAKDFELWEKAYAVYN